MAALSGCRTQTRPNSRRPDRN